MTRAARQRGFTYLSLMITLSVMGLVAAASLKMGTLFQRAAQEEELLEIGAQFSEALRSYAAATPPGQPQQPPTLQDLLRDPRFPNVRRHLRKIFVDPVSGKAEWGVVYLGDKVGVVAVHSLSDRKPLKVGNFDLRFAGMENKERISDWKFMMAGGDGNPGTIATPPNSMTGAGTPGALAPQATSLFGSNAGGKAGAAQSGATKADEAAAPKPPDQPPVEEAPAPEEEQQPEVEAGEKQGRNRDGDDEALPTDGAVPVTPPPPPRRR